jgi:glycerol-3-phosphate acyltransferase PlsX
MARIAADLMGSDKGIKIVLEGALRASSEGIEIVLVGDREKILQANPEAGKLEIVNATQEVLMTDDPMGVIRLKRDSSMAVGARYVSDGNASALVSTGNTGALLVAASLIIGRTPGNSRPALGVVLPGLNGPSMLIDAGANPDCEAQNLLEFGIMGSAYMNKVLGIDNPKVALLNNGTEEKKGREYVREAYRLLKGTELNFVGNIEGRDIMTTASHVMVCDGFTGNVTLKVIEGMGSVFSRIIKEAAMKNVASKVGALLMKPSLKGLYKKLDYSHYGGAPLLGLKKLVIKAHGSSNSYAYYNALKVAAHAIDSKVDETIATAFAPYKKASLGGETNDRTAGI